MGDDLFVIFSSIKFANMSLISSRLFQYFVEAGAIAVRRVRKDDLRHVAKATGATMVRSLHLEKILSFYFTLES